MLFDGVLYEMALIENPHFNRGRECKIIECTNSIRIIPSKRFDSSRILKILCMSPSIESIEPGAFEYCHQLTLVFFSPGIKSIGRRVFFACSKLPFLALPPSVESIEESAFDGCCSLRFLYLPPSLKTIGKKAFFNSGLIELFIPSGVESIEEAAFWGCDRLRSVVLPESLQKIGEYAFPNNIEVIIIDTQKESEFNRIRALLPTALQSRAVDKKNEKAIKILNIRSKQEFGVKNYLKRFPQIAQKFSLKSVKESQKDPATVLSDSPYFQNLLFSTPEVLPRCRRRLMPSADPASKTSCRP